MPGDDDIVTRIKTLLAAGSRLPELSALLETAIQSEDRDTSAYAAKVFMVCGANILPLFACRDENDNITGEDVDAMMSNIPSLDIEAASEEVFATLGQTPDEAVGMMRNILQLRAEARRKSGYTGP